MCRTYVTLLVDDEETQRYLAIFKKHTGAHCLCCDDPETCDGPCPLCDCRYAERMGS